MEGVVYFSAFCSLKLESLLQLISIYMHIAIYGWLGKYPSAIYICSYIGTMYHFIFEPTQTAFEDPFMKSRHILPSLTSIPKAEIPQNPGDTCSPHIYGSLHRNNTICHFIYQRTHPSKLVRGRNQPQHVTRGLKFVCRTRLQALYCMGGTAVTTCTSYPTLFFFFSTSRSKYKRTLTFARFLGSLDNPLVRAAPS